MPRGREKQEAKIIIGVYITLPNEPTKNIVCATFMERQEIIDSYRHVPGVCVESYTHITEPAQHEHVIPTASRWSLLPGVC